MGDPVNPSTDLVATDKNGCNALLRAAENGRPNTVRDLLRQGAAVDAKHRSGVTALMLAARQGHLQIVKMLLDAGANPDIAVSTVHSCCATAITYAMTYSGAKRPEVVSAMVEAIIAAEAKLKSKRASGNTSLIYALLSQDTAMVEMLLAKGADINAEGEHGVTPLMVAVGTGNLKFITALIAAGADVNARTDEGKTALSLVEELSNESKSTNQDEITRLLRQAGAKR